VPGPHSRIYADQLEAPKCAAGRFPPSLARGTETRGIVKDDPPTRPCELGVDRSPMQIAPVVASEGNRGRLGNCADSAAARSPADVHRELGNDPDRNHRHRATRFSAASTVIDSAGPTIRSHTSRRALSGLADRTDDGDDDIDRHRVRKYSYPIAGSSDATCDLPEPEPSQFSDLIASSAAGYTSVPFVSTCAAGVSLAGSTLPLPIMCMTGTPCAKR
jgi:hypothetical protein